MPSFQDSAFIILLGLLLFGPKGMAKMARQAGKLVGEFRRASAEFRLQMEDELRLSEQEDQQKKIEAMEAAAPVSVLPATVEVPEVVHPHMPPPENADAAENRIDTPFGELPPYIAPAESAELSETVESEPLPIAASGDLEMMPPATGLPIGRGASTRSASSESLSGVFDSIPHVPEREHEAAGLAGNGNG